MDTENLPCFDCGKTATWLYMPSSELPEEQRWACDEHVPRGCSCNDEPADGDYDNGDPANWEQATDSQGRKRPCCEWWPLHEYSVLANGAYQPTPGNGGSALSVSAGSEIPTPLTDKEAVSVCLNWDNQGDVCRSVVPAELAKKLERNLRCAGDDIVKLRTALNRIAHPASYGTEGMDPKEIARRALILGMTVKPLPYPNAGGQTRDEPGSAS